MTRDSDAGEGAEAASGVGGQSASQAVTNPGGFRTSPIGHVYGIVDNPDHDVPAVVGDLLAAHLPLDGIHVYCCREGIDALDPSGTKHGLRARITRMVQSVTYDDDHLEVIESHLEAGHALIGVAADDSNQDSVATILRRHGGHDLVHYGKLTWERLGPTSHQQHPTEP